MAAGGPSPEGGSLDNAGNAATGAAAATDAAAAYTAEAIASTVRVGRPVASTTATLDPALVPGVVQSPNVYVWRGGAQATGALLGAGAKLFGAAGTVMDTYSGIQAAKQGDGFGAALDFTSASAGGAMLWSFEAAAPVAIPVIVTAKLVPLSVQGIVQQACLGVSLDDIAAGFSAAF